jgi:hypothetical protein
VVNGEPLFWSTRTCPDLLNTDLAALQAPGPSVSGLNSAFAARARSLASFSARLHPDRGTKDHSPVATGLESFVRTGQTVDLHLTSDSAT